MKRDHLMGYAPAADVSAQCPTEYDEFDLLYQNEPFPLGLPRRMLYDLQAERAPERARRQRLQLFERKVHPLPDGTHVSSGGMAWVTTELKADGPVMQPTEHAYREVFGPGLGDPVAPNDVVTALKLTNWTFRKPPAAQAFNDGLAFYLGGRQVTREEYQAWLKEQPDESKARTAWEQLERYRTRGIAAEALGKAVAERANQAAVGLGALVSQQAPAIREAIGAATQYTAAALLRAQDSYHSTPEPLQCGCKACVAFRSLTGPNG